MIKIFRISNYLFLMFIVSFLSWGIISCVDDDGSDLQYQSWHKVNDRSMPYPSYSRMVAFDENRGVLVVFGGTAISDTWEYDGESWERIETKHAPPAVSYASMCYHGGMQGIFLCMGSLIEGGGSVRIPWFYDGTDWVELDGGEQLPPARESVPICYYPDHDSVMLYIGAAANQGTADTWEWANGQWTPIWNTYHPYAKSGAAMVYDPVSHKILLYGGQSSDPKSNETWCWDHYGWSQFSFANSPPVYSHVSMAYDERLGAVWMLGGNNRNVRNLWKLTIAGWEFVYELPLRYTYSSYLFKDDTSNYLWLYLPTSGKYSYQADSRFFKIGYNEFIEENGSEGPRCTEGHNPLAYDGRNNKTYLFTTREARNNGNLYEYEDGHWVLLAESPLTHSYSIDDLILVIDEKRQVPMVFTGRYSYEDFTVFEYEDGIWHERIFPDGPQIDRNFSVAYDSSRGVTVLFGANYGGNPPLPQTWEYDGTTWQRMSPPRSPSARQDASMTYDSEGQRIVLFGGREIYPGGQVYQRDTWSYDGMTWSRIHTAHAPISTGPMVFQPDRHRIIMSTSRGVDATQENEFWQFDGLDWKPFVAPDGPCDRRDGNLVYNSTDRYFLFFGGDYGNSYSDRVYFSDTWKLEQ